MKLNETNRILWTLAALGLALLLCGCGCLQEQETPETPAAVTAGDSRETEETGLTIAAVENRFSISLWRRLFAAAMPVTAAISCRPGTSGGRRHIPAAPTPTGKPGVSALWRMKICILCP